VNAALARTTSSFAPARWRARQSLQIETIGTVRSLVEDDLFGKAASTFPDHAFTGA
jgi:hypothetical protein